MDIKILSSVDTIYYYCDVPKENYFNFYQEYILKNIDKLISDDFHLLSTFDKDKIPQFINFRKIKILDNNRKIPMFRIGFKNLNENDNLLYIRIQSEATALLMYGLDGFIEYVDNFLMSLGFEVVDKQISELDINALVHGFDFSFINYEWFRSKAYKSGIISTEKINSKEYSKAGKLETFYLGSRNSIQLKVYDKAKELAKIENTLKWAILEALFYNKFGISFGNNLWNVEFSLKREKLKFYKIKTVDEAIPKINSLFKELMEKFVMIDLNSSTSKQKIRYKVHPVWEFIKNTYDYNGYSALELERIDFTKHFMGKDWLLGRMRKFLKINGVDGEKMIIEVIEKIKKEYGLAV